LQAKLFPSDRISDLLPPSYGLPASKPAILRRIPCIERHIPRTELRKPGIDHQKPGIAPRIARIVSRKPGIEARKPDLESRKPSIPLPIPRIQYRKPGIVCGRKFGLVCDVFRLPLPHSDPVFTCLSRPLLNSTLIENVFG
jgi:hypothetical protein